MMEKTEMMLRYEKMHDDCRAIFRGDRDLAQKLEEFNRYLEGHQGAEDNGTLRTLLVIGKAFKENPIVKDTLDRMDHTLRTRLGVDRI
jgi:hypothetical protein